MALTDCEIYLKANEAAAQGKSIEEQAAACELSVGALRMRMHRARRRYTVTAAVWLPTEDTPGNDAP